MIGSKPENQFDKQLNGILLVDKPQGFTSHDVVAKLRGILKTRRIGHSGTLDPLATGLLVVFVGRATRAVEFTNNDGKTYIAGLRLGVSTDTQDITGNILPQNFGENGLCYNPGNVSEAELLSVIKTFLGETDQIPPMYSAIKIGGRKLYEIARKGGEIDRIPRKITINEITLLGRANSGGKAAPQHSGEDFLLRVDCGKGTYIRTLCADIGEKLNTGGCMFSLRRIRAGKFSVDDAYTLDEIEQAAAGRFSGDIDENSVKHSIDSLLLPVEALFGDYPTVTISGDDEKKCRNGAEFMLHGDNGFCKVFSHSGEFLMVGKIQNNRVSTVKSFFEV